MDDVAAFRSLNTSWRADPTRFVRDAWGHTAWKSQADMYRAMWRDPTVLATGGHSTGKTHGFAWFVCHYLPTTPGAQILIIGPTFDQIKTRLWEQVRKAYFASRIPLGGRMMAEEWKIKDGWFARIAGADKPETLQGLHGVGIVVMVDEAAGVEAKLWPALNSLLASDGAKLIAGCNPTDPGGKTRDLADDPTVTHIELSCLDHPNVVEGREVIPGAVTRGWVEKMREDLRRGIIDDDAWRSRVLGQFATGGANSVVSRADLEATADGTKNVRTERRIGLDVARMGGDRSVLSVLDETRAVIAVDAWAKVDLMETTGRLIAAMREHGVIAENVGVDVCGVGAGVVDRMRELGHNVAAVDFGAGPSGSFAEWIGTDATMKNVRAEAHWGARAMLKAGALCVPRRFRETWADACAARYRYGSETLVVESKDDIKKRIGRSPDYWDSVLIALAATRAPVGCVWA